MPWTFLSHIYLFSPPADGEHHWKLANIPFSVQTKFRYGFQGIRGDPATSAGGIAIDDTSLTETNCPTNIWHIRNFTSLFNRTSKGDYITSPVFYSSEGYAFALQLYPHGRNSSPYVNYMGITFHLCSSQNDGLLEWPAGHRQVILSALDQDPDVIRRMSLSLSFTTDPKQLVYGKSECFREKRANAEVLSSWRKVLKAERLRQICPACDTTGFTGDQF